MQLDDVFDESVKVEAEESETATEQVADEQEAAESETTSQSESTDEESKENDSELKEEPKTEEKDDNSWTLKAVKDERRKRQELERERDELLAKLEKKQDKELPDVFDDQKGFVDGLRAEYKQELSRAKLELAREVMLDTHDDYEEMEKLFIETVAKDYPVLAQEAGRSTNPAKFVYQQAKKYTEAQKLKDVDAYKAQLREELKKELEAELSEKQKKQSSIKPSLATARATTANDVSENVSLETLIP